jgi:hypothetical protein
LKFINFLAPGSGFPIRIRIHKVTESGSNPDPDPQPCRIELHKNYYGLRLGTCGPRGLFPGLPLCCPPPLSLSWSMLSVRLLLSYSILCLTSLASPTHELLLSLPNLLGLSSVLSLTSLASPTLGLLRSLSNLLSPSYAWAPPFSV